MDVKLMREIEQARQAVARDPQDQKALKYLANLYMLQGQYKEVLVLSERMLIVDPQNYEALYMAAMAYFYLDDAATAFELALQVVKIKPDYIGAYMSMAFYYGQKSMLREKMAMLEKVVCLGEKIYGSSFENDLVSEAWLQLAIAHVALGNISACKKAYLKRGVTKKLLAEKCKAYSSYLMCSNYDAALSNAEMLAEHKKYNDFFKDVKPYPQAKPVLKKKLRIGYISPDFYEHVVMYFAEPLLWNYNPEKFAVFCYRKGKKDEKTAQLCNAPGTVWRDITKLEPAAAAKLIYDDKIDILVDLAGHTADNCLPVLAYKPAPLQISGIGYFSTTGLAAVDYFLTDVYVDPTGCNDACFTEKLLRLPHTHWCYAKKKEVPDCAEAPYKKNGYVTFCSFNTFAKITDPMLRLWWRILQAVPESRLVLKSKVFENFYGIQVVSVRLGRLGFDLSRVLFRPATRTYMQEYLEMDIALDTSPYVGGATTCEALFMGVPVVTLAGERHGSRFGYSMLKNIGLEECIARTEDEYVAKAVALANAGQRLNSLHEGRLREMMLASPLMDARSYMHDLEAAYAEMWHKAAAACPLAQNTSLEYNTVNSY